MHIAMCKVHFKARHSETDLRAQEKKKSCSIAGCGQNAHHKKPHCFRDDLSHLEGPNGGDQHISCVFT